MRTDAGRTGERVSEAEISHLYANGVSKEELREMLSREYLSGLMAGARQKEREWQQTVREAVLSACFFAPIFYIVATSC